MRVFSDWAGAGRFWRSAAAVAAFCVLAGCGSSASSGPPANNGVGVSGPSRAPGTTGGSPLSVSDYEEQGSAALNRVLEVQAELKSKVDDPASWNQAANVLSKATRTFEQLVPPPQYASLNSQLISGLSRLATTAGEIRGELEKGDQTAAKASMNEYKSGLAFTIGAIAKFHQIKT